MTIYDTLDANALAILKKIQARYDLPRIVNAHTLDFAWRKDGKEGREEADAIKDLLRYLPALIRKAEASPDPDYVSPVASPSSEGDAARPRRARRNISGALHQS